MKRWQWKEIKRLCESERTRGKQRCREWWRQMEWHLRSGDDRVGMKVKAIFSPCSQACTHTHTHTSRLICSCIHAFTTLTNVFFRAESESLQTSNYNSSGFYNDPSSQKMKGGLSVKKDYHQPRVRHSAILNPRWTWVRGRAAALTFYKVNK